MKLKVTDLLFSKAEVPNHLAHFITGLEDGQTGTPKSPINKSTSRMETFKQHVTNDSKVWEPLDYGMR
jgi:hypothetical protein